jgi:hypothetical protein
LLPELGQESKYIYIYIYSQIWLNPLVADCHFWSNMRKIKEQTGKKIKKYCSTYLKKFEKNKKIW